MIEEKETLYNYKSPRTVTGRQIRCRKDSTCSSKSRYWNGCNKVQTSRLESRWRSIFTDFRLMDDFYRMHL